MLRAVSESLFHTLLDAFPPDRAYSRAAFEREPMPPPVSLFLSQVLQERLEHEAPLGRAASSEWFDYRHPEVQRATESLAAALARHAQIPRDAWAQILEQSVDQVVQYLVRPAHTLTDFIFEDHSDALPASTIFRRFDYFGAYSYLREVVERYFDQKNLREIDRTRFTSLLQRVDQQMTADYTAEDWLRLLEPLYDLLQRAPVASEAAPVALLRAFFKEKGAHQIEQRLQAAHERNGVERVTKHDLRRLIDAVQEPAPAPPPESPHRPAADPTEPQPARPAAGKEEALPLWMQFQRGLRPDAENASPPAVPPEVTSPRKTPRPTPPPTPPSQEPAPRADEHPQPRWMQFRAAAPPPSPAAFPDLSALERDVLGERGARDRDLFVKHLFASSLEEYERVLRRLQPVTSWSQASQVIAQEVFKRNQVNIYSDPAIAFTNAIEVRCRENA